jgi:glucose/mannose-6-phosphate isomerase
MMRNLIEQFPAHLLQSIKLAEEQPLKNKVPNFNKVVISGLGGSGIGGTMVADLCKPFASVPVLVNKDYTIPAYVDAQTVFVACSYSGNTEETLEALALAQKSGAHCIAITSGGTLQSIAEKDGLSIRIIPGGLPPRAALGYSLAQLIMLFRELHLLPGGIKTELEEAAVLLTSMSAGLDKKAREYAVALHDKMPILYCDAALEGVAVRFRQQINENGKMLCWHHVIPEMNHNELVGWTDTNDSLAVIFLRTHQDYARNKTRMEINKEIVGKYTPHVWEFWAEGSSALAATLYLIHLTDFISLHLAELRNKDVVEVKVIDFLKGELAKI